MMRWLRDARFLGALVATNLRASLALRGAFLVQAAFMAINNLLFLVFWWLLFDRFEEIRGWRLPDMAALFGISAAGYGLMMVFAGGVTELSRRIAAGGLDAILTQPRDALLLAIGSETRAHGWGDLVSGIGLVVVSGYLDWTTWPLVLLFALLAGVIFTASAVIVHSCAFWLGRVEGIARQANELLITFSLYPPTLFGPAVKVVLFTLIPAGFVSFLPVQLLRAFSWTDLGLLAGAATFYGALAVFVFRRGLRSYASGNRFSMS